MSDLIPIQDQKPSYLAKVKAASASEFISGVEGGMPLPALSVRGKEFRLRFQGQEHNTRERQLDVIFVAARPGVSKRYFIKGYESGETSAPDCSSADGITPDVADPISPKCATCPKNAWGSGNHGKGKACNDYKRLVVAPLIDGRIAEQPAVLDVSATALKRPREYRGPEQFLREYLTALHRHDIPEQSAVTRLGFTDAEYPQLHFAFSRFAEEGEYTHAVALREHPDVATVLEAGAQEAPGPIQEVSQEPEPAPAPKPQAKAKPKAKPKVTKLEEPAYVWNDDTETGQEVHTQEELKEWLSNGAEKVSAKMFMRLSGATETSKDDSPAPSAAADATDEPVQEAQSPTTDATPDGGSDDDPMAEVRDLLKGLS